MFYIKRYLGEFIASVNFWSIHITMKGLQLSCCLLVSTLFSASLSCIITCNEAANNCPGLRPPRPALASLENNSPLDFGFNVTTDGFWGTLHSWGNITAMSTDASIFVGKYLITG